MRSSLGILLLAFACGVASLQQSAALPPHTIAILVSSALAAGTAASAHACGRLSARRAMIVAVLAIYALGFGYAAWRAELRLADALPLAWEGVDIRLVGVVDELPTESERGVRFAFAVEEVRTPRAIVPSRLSLSWIAQRQGSAPISEMPAIRAGERWQLTVRLKRPHGNVNPGGFDLEGWLLQQGLRATGYVRPDTNNMRRDAFAGRFRDYVQRARERVRARVVEALPGAPYAGVIAALAIGDQRSVTEAQWRIFNRTGVGHLVSISGLHVTVFAAIAGGVAFALARRSTRLTSRVPARKVAAVIGALAALGYVLLAGAEVPAMRTFAMLAVGAVGVWLGRPGTVGIVWLWALAVVLVWDPWATLTPGFWLSFGAVAILLYAAVGRLHAPHGAPIRQRLGRMLGESAHAQWVITVGLTPLTLALFQQMSLIAPIANAVAIPVVALAVVPLALTGIFVPFAVFFQIAHAVFSPLMRVLELLATMPDAAWQQHAPPQWTVVAGIMGTLWVLAPRAVPGRGWGLLWMVPLFLVRPPPLPEGAFRLTVLDVGQGLAVVIETRRYTLVYDTGPRFTETSDAGGRIIVPFLRATGRRRADGLIVSHQDLDHSGGALSLMQAVPVGWFASSLYADHPIVASAGANGPTMACLAGQTWSWDGVRFAVLHPTFAEYDDRYVKTNDRSCVVRIDSDHGSVLLAGDIETKAEAHLVGRDPALLRADVIVVPHHGSRTSSTHAFIRAVGADIAIVACGYANRFGHPRADVVARYVRSGAKVLRTDQSGAIALTFAPAHPLVAQFARLDRPRYWLDIPVAAPAADD